MQAFFINLQRRPDRRDAQRLQLAALRVPAMRIDALDAETADRRDIELGFAPNGPLGILSAADKACSQSHRRAWRALVASGNRFGLIVEDDIAFDPAAAALLQSDGWIPDGIELVKLEHFGPPHQRVLVDDVRTIPTGHRLARLLSRHAGAGAYVLSRRLAETLLDPAILWPVPVDHMLFSPYISPVFDILTPYQLLPAIGRQCGSASDIVRSRKARQRSTLRHLKEDLVKGWNDVRQIPGQAAALARGARLMRVSQP
jgi:glycosyl transferase, family 25